MEPSPFQLPKLPGFQPDAAPSATGWIVTPEGPRRIFVKQSRNADRLQEEARALQLIQQHVGFRIAPTLYGVLDGCDDLHMALSYEEGLNLADLLTPGPSAPPMPSWYPAQGEMTLPEDQLLPLLSEISQAVRALHQIPLDQFGKLVVYDPNPYRGAARDYTWQEVCHRLLLAEQKGHLAGPLLAKAQAWGSNRIDLLQNDETARLIHYDLHSGNIRVFQQGGRWRFGVLFDFELARGWLPEYDLAGMRWYLDDFMGGTAGTAAWNCFLEGCGGADPERLALFEYIRALTAIAYMERYLQWGNWCQAKLVSLLESS